MAKADFDYTIHTENKTLAIVDLDKGMDGIIFKEISSCYSGNLSRVLLKN